MKRLLPILVFVAIVLWLLVWLAGCSPRVQQSITNTAIDHSVDSNSYIEKVHIDTVLVKGDSVVMQVPVYVKCPDNKMPVFTPEAVSNKSSRATEQVSINKSGIVTADCDCDDVRLQSINKDVYISHINSVVDSLSHVSFTVKQVRYVPVLYKWSMGFSILFIILLAAYFGIKYFKPTYLSWLIKLIPFL